MNENSGVFMSKFRYLLTFDTSTYLDRKEKTGLWTYFLFFSPNQNCPWRKNGNLKKIKILIRSLWRRRWPRKI